jgi:hypothetical protein
LFKSQKLLTTEELFVHELVHVVFVLDFCPLLLFLFNDDSHFATLLLENDQILVLVFHSLLVLSLLLLKATEMILGFLQLPIQIVYFPLIIVFFAEGLQSSLLIFLHFHKRPVFVLELFEDPLLVLLLVLQLSYFLDVVAFFQLATHRVDFFLVKVDLGLDVPQLTLLCLDVRIRRNGLAVPDSSLDFSTWVLLLRTDSLLMFIFERLKLSCFRLLHKLFELKTQMLQFALKTLVLSF